MFSIYFGLSNKFFSFKNRKLFLKIENKGKKQLSNIPLVWLYKELKKKKKKKEEEEEEEGYQQMWCSYHRMWHCYYTM